LLPPWQRGSPHRADAFRFKHEPREERRDLRVPVDRQDVGNVLIRAHDHDATGGTINAAQGVDIGV
jgi:hypothetical protein